MSDGPGRRLPYQGLPIAANSAIGDRGEPAPSISYRQTPPPGTDMARLSGERNRPRMAHCIRPGNSHWKRLSLVVVARPEEFGRVRTTTAAGSTYTGDPAFILVAGCPKDR